MRTDTTRIPVIGGELADTTVSIPAPWLRPPVTSRHLTPQARAARRWQRVRGSQFAADIRAGVHRGLAVMGVVAVALTLVVLIRGAYVFAEIAGVAP